MLRIEPSAAGWEAKMLPLNLPGIRVNNHDQELKNFAMPFVFVIKALAFVTLSSCTRWIRSTVLSFCTVYLILRSAAVVLSQ